jgi:WD40 repeat protein
LSAEELAVTERDIFHGAVQLMDPAERSAYLEEACAGSDALKRHVEDMLQAYLELGTFLESPAVDFQGAPGPPLSAGRFQLGRELARGGMGVVYCARDESLGRDVAVKVLHERYQVNSLVGERFLDEARITAQLQHPGIPPVFEVGHLGDGRPYLAMKLIKGRTLEHLLNTTSDLAGDRGRFLAVFAQVCQAVAYAHSKHILHRDLKPANVMVGAFGEVQVMDWGLAKLLSPGDGAGHELAAATETPCGTVIQTSRQSDSATLAGSMLGTPAFMAPEQAGGEIDRLDERTDVFGLGAILCVILTGEPPYRGKTGDELRLMAVRGTIADAHARLDQCGADAKLVELCQACLSAEREARPRDAGAVAATVAGYLATVEERARQAQLEHAAAEARAGEQRKRRRVQRILTVTVLLALLGGIVATTWQALRATLAESDSLGEAERNRRLLYSADVHLASQVWQGKEGTVALCQELLLAHVPGPGQADLREFCWRYQWRLLHRGAVLPLPVVPQAAAVAADGRVVTLDQTGKVYEWQIGELTPREKLTLAGGSLLGVTLARNGAVAAVIDRDGSPKVFDVRTGLEKVQIRPPSALVNIKLSADGRFLVGVGRDEHARVWDAVTGQELYVHLMIDPTAKQIDLSSDGKQLLASWGDQGTVVVLYRAGLEKPMVLNDEEAVRGFNRLQGAFSPDGKLAAVARFGNGVEFYDTTTRKLLPILLRTRGAPVRITFSPDGSQLAVGEHTGLVTLFRLPEPTSSEQPAAGAPALTATGQALESTLKGHQGRIEALAFTADGRKLISIGRDKTARFWDVDDQEESRVLQKGRGQIDGLNYSSDGRYLVESSMTDGIHVHDLTSTAKPRTLATRSSRRAIFSPDGRLIAGAPDHRVTLWDAQTGALLSTLSKAEPDEIGAMAFSPDGQWLAVGVGGPHNFAVDSPQKVMVFDVARRKQHWAYATLTQVNGITFSADGKLLAAAGHDGTIWLWDTSSWDEVARWQEPAGAHYGSLLFLPASRLGQAGQGRGRGRASDLLAAGSTSGTIDLWDVTTHGLARQIYGHISLVTALDLSPDGRTLASTSCDCSIKLWDLGTGRELRTLYHGEGWMYALAFSPDGNTLATGGLSAVVRLWEASSKETVDADLAELDLKAKSSGPKR